MSFRYDASVMISLLLILIVGSNYLSLIVIFIVMVKAFIINYEVC